MTIPCLSLPDPCLSLTKVRHPDHLLSEAVSTVALLCWLLVIGDWGPIILTLIASTRPNPRPATHCSQSSNNKDGSVSLHIVMRLGWGHFGTWTHLALNWRDTQPGYEDSSIIMKDISRTNAATNIWKLKVLLAMKGWYIFLLISIELLAQW